MVSVVRRGQSLRAVARLFGVSLLTVQRWVSRAGDERLDRVDWSDRPSCPLSSPNRTLDSLERRILDLRQELKASALGEYGAAAIRYALFQEGQSHPPSERTIHRILDRRGALDGRHRPPRRPPAPGWYLSDVSSRISEMDLIDIVEGLVIRPRIEVEVLNIVSLHGGLIESWPSTPSRAKEVRERLIAHWRAFGLPAYAQFDNDTRFLGPSNHPDVIGSVSRFCLSLGVVPVFAPPRESGFQAAIESLNGRWQAKVWVRFRHQTLEDLQSLSGRYVQASRMRHAQRIDSAPPRRPFPQEWTLTKERLQKPPDGRLVMIRRTNDNGQVHLLGHTFMVDTHWPHRLVRSEVDLDNDRIRFYALRRREPATQPLLNEAVYELPLRKFRLADFE